MRRIPAALLGLLGAIGMCGAGGLAAQATLLDLVLTGEDGRPLARQDVALCAGDATGVGFPATALQKPLLSRTDESGHCVFAVPSFDQYWLRIGGVDAVHDAWPVLPSDARQRLQIAAPGAIEVVDALADERPADSELRVMVRALTPAGEAVERRGRGDRLAISRLRPGRYVVALVVEGHRYTQHTVTVQAGETLRCKLYPADGAPTAGRVLDAAGAPLVGARLFGSPNSLLDVQTDADGRFDLGRCGGMAMRNIWLQAPGLAPQPIALAELLEQAGEQGRDTRALELRIAAPTPPTRLRLLRPGGAPLVGVRAMLLQHGRREVLQPERGAGEALQLGYSGAAAARLFVLADDCALCAGPASAGDDLELAPGVTRVLRMPAELVGAPTDAVRWLQVRQQDHSPRTVPICQDGRVLVSHLAPIDSGIQWEADGNRSGSSLLDERPFAELDLR